MVYRLPGPGRGLALVEPLEAAEHGVCPVQVAAAAGAEAQLAQRRGGGHRQHVVLARPGAALVASEKYLISLHFHNKFISLPAATRCVAGPLRLDGLGGQVLGLQLVHRPPEVKVVITLALGLAILQVWKQGPMKHLLKLSC